MTTSGITTTIAGSSARALLARARFTQDKQGCWSAPDGRRTWSAEEALTWALITLAENGGDQ